MNIFYVFQIFYGPVKIDIKLRNNSHNIYCCSRIITLFLCYIGCTTDFFPYFFFFLIFFAVFILAMCIIPISVVEFGLWKLKFPSCCLEYELRLDIFSEVKHVFMTVRVRT